MLCWVWNVKHGIDIKDSRGRVLSSISEYDSDAFIRHIESLEDRLGSEGAVSAVQKFLKRYVPAGKLTAAQKGYV